LVALATLLLTASFDWLHTLHGFTNDALLAVGVAAGVNFYLVRRIQTLDACLNNPLKTQPKPCQ